MNYYYVQHGCGLFLRQLGSVGEVSLLLCA